MSSVSHLRELLLALLDQLGDAEEVLAAALGPERGPGGERVAGGLDGARSPRRRRRARCRRGATRRSARCPRTSRPRRAPRRCSDRRDCDPGTRGQSRHVPTPPPWVGRGHPARSSVRRSARACANCDEAARHASPRAPPARRGARSASRPACADRGQLLRALDDPVRQPPDPVHLDLDEVAGLHGPRVRRRPGEEHVAGLERDQPREVGEHVRERPEQLARVPLLDDLAVHVRPEARGPSGSTSAASTSSGPIGQNPSWPFTRSIEPRSAWRKSWTPKSFAGA